ncbi:phosphatidic acid phosphatase type 2/haloperoxidase [Lipomyces japonicus]|uniref:phosphatidic acid phosphatase type 2/haloperoxidase n=1 Tax=Lipomyces japonicus TaxID=56871 RepID=UPI0034CE1B04
MSPFYRLFSLDDESIQHPYATTERVTSINGVIYSTVISTGIVVLFTPFLHRRRRRSSSSSSRGDARTNWIHVLNVSLLSLALSLILTEFVTEIFKNSIGRLRPDFIARCMPRPGTPLTGLVGVEVCTNPSLQVLNDGFRSTPSGHSSNAFAGLGWLSAWTAGQLKVFRPGKELFRTMLALLPLVGASLIGISRIEDYRHHVTDILFGGVLGSLIAWYSYRKYFPHLGTDTCNVPFPAPASSLSSSNGVKDSLDQHDYYDSLDELEAGESAKQYPD